MIGGILFVIVVWFIPILIWYLIQGKNEFTLKPNCNSLTKEQKDSKIAFFCALGFGVLVILLILLLG